MVEGYATTTAIKVMVKNFKVAIAIPWQQQSKTSKLQLLPLFSLCRWDRHQYHSLSHGQHHAGHGKLRQVQAKATLRCWLSAHLPRKRVSGCGLSSCHAWGLSCYYDLPQWTILVAIVLNAFLKWMWQRLSWWNDRHTKIYYPATLSTWMSWLPHFRGSLPSKV